jgi:hypothetical protein
MPCEADVKWAELNARLTPMQRQVVVWLARTGREPYAAARAGLCSEPAVTKWKPQNVRRWVDVYKAAHPSAVLAADEARKELIRLAPAASDLITATVNGTAGKRATPMSTRLAQWTLEQVNELAKLEREASVTASAEDGTDDSDELGDLLRLAQ